MSERLVLKFGGSSVSTPKQIQSIAKKIAQLHTAGNELILVVSAMGKTTDELTRLAYQVSPHPTRRELDMLISTGERVSMSLMTMALLDLNCLAISFTGSQAGILTDGDFSNAKIIDIRPQRVEESLRQKKIVVLAGFQGVDPETKEITTLGRGGSDTTAVAFAAHFKANRCEILKDVDGIFSSDPKLNPKAQLYKKLPLRTALEMSFWGAKVLSYRAAELAAKNKIPLFIGRSDNFQIGTELIEDNNMYEQFSIAGVTSHQEVHHVKITGSASAEAYQTFGNILREQKLPYPQILASSYESGACRLTYTADAELLQSLRLTLMNSSKAEMGKVLSSVTVTCFGGVHSGVLEKLVLKLQKNGIPTEKIVTSALSITFFIHPENLDKTIQCLNE